MRSVLAVVAVVALLLATQFFLGPHVARQQAARARGGCAVMRMRPGRYVSLSALAFAPSAFIVWVVMSIAHGTDLVDGGALLLASALVSVGVTTGAWCLAAEFRERIRVDRSGLDWVGVLGRRHVHWGDIACVAYNPGHHWFFVTLADGTHLWIWDDLVEIAAFAEFALAWLPPASLFADPGARAALEELALGDPVSC